MKKTLILLLAFIPLSIYSQGVNICGCTIGSDPYFGFVLTYATARGTSCANPSAGAALSQFYVNGQLQDEGYVDSQQAANFCQLNTAAEVVSSIIPLLSVGSEGAGNGVDPYSYNYDDDEWYYYDRPVPET